IQSTDPAEIAKLWGQVDEKVMTDAIVIPIASPRSNVYHSDRVQNFVPYALSVQGDWTNVSLK
ncbi:MAG: ABC transporter substrate-binding protein, partial [Leifsonia sp.]